MKLAVAFVAGLVLGVALVLALRPEAGRYSITARDGYIMRLDTVTGRTWFDTTNGWRRFWE